MSDIGIMLVFGCILLIMLALIRFFAWLTELQEAHGSVPRAAAHAIQRYVIARPVKNYDDAPSIVMSRSEDEEAPRSLSDLRQTEPQTDRQTYNRAGMIDIYKLMRKYGIPREEARAAFQAAALPLDNNQWTKVAPAVTESPHITPIVGRSTSAKFETDPELVYQPPDQPPD